MKPPARLGFGKRVDPEARTTVPPPDPNGSLRSYVPSIEAGARAIRFMVDRDLKALRFTDAELRITEANRLERLAALLDRGRAK